MYNISMQKTAFLGAFDYPDFRLSECLTTIISPVNRVSTVVEFFVPEGEDICTNCTGNASFHCYNWKVTYSAHQVTR